MTAFNEAEPKAIPTLPAIIAAAGQSRRYGSPKLLVPLPGKSITLIEHVVGELLIGGAAPALVVTGPANEEPYKRIGELAAIAGAQVIHKSPAPNEMIDSILAGMDALKQSRKIADWSNSHLLITPADLPGISASFVRKLIEISNSTPQPMVRGLTPEGRGIHPVSIHLTLLENDLLALKSEGLKSLWKDPEIGRLEFNWHNSQISCDLDNPRDWDQFAPNG